MTGKIIDIRQRLADRMIERLGAFQRSPEETTHLMFKAGMDLRLATNEIAKDWGVQEAISDYLWGLEYREDLWTEDGAGYSEAGYDFMANLVIEACAFQLSRRFAILLVIHLMVSAGSEPKKGFFSSIDRLPWAANLRIPPRIGNSASTRDR